MQLTRRYFPRGGMITIAFAILTIISIQYASATTANNGVCDSYDDGSGAKKQCLAVASASAVSSSSATATATKTRRLSPSDLPIPNLFDNFGANISVTVAIASDGDNNRDVTLTVMPGTILQQGKHLRHGDKKDDKKSSDRSELVVVPELIPRSVVAELLTLLRGHEDIDLANGTTTIALDQDPDSVDGMTSQEIFLDNDGLRRGEPSKSDPNEIYDTERKELRKKLKAVTDHYLHNVMTPFIQEWYGIDKCGLEGRKCTPCYSLIRRYRAGERQSHLPHNDSHSFVTVVVSLADYGREYIGGLFVSAKSSERNYVKLNRGDAVAHQSDLHHGVKVFNDRDDGGTSERWSWILWFRDSDTCDDHGQEWHRDCSEEGNPTCMYLRASKEETAASVVHWNEKASAGGHSQASVKLAYAYLKRLPSHLQFDREKAKDLFREAIFSSNEPEGHYGMASLILEELKFGVLKQPTNEAKSQSARKTIASSDILEAIVHLEEAAKAGHVFAMFNLGICSTYGYGQVDGRRDFELAIDWFEASGLPEGLFAKAMYLKTIGKNREAEDYNAKAGILGYGSPWRKLAREQTGSGGFSAANLNLPWPPLPTSEMPQEW